MKDPSVSVPVSAQDAAYALAQAERALKNGITRLSRQLAGDQARVRLVLGAYAPYQEYLRVRDRYARVSDLAARSPRHQQQSEQLQRAVIKSATRAAAELHEWVDNRDQLDTILKKLESTTGSARHFLDTVHQAHRLAERRAHLTSRVHQAEYRLAQLPQLTVRQRSLRQQLQAFSALRDFSHIPRDPTEQAQLESLLVELERVYDRLELDIQALPDAHVVPDVAESLAPIPRNSTARDDIDEGDDQGEAVTLGEDRDLDLFEVDDGRDADAVVVLPSVETAVTDHVPTESDVTLTTSGVDESADDAWEVDGYGADIDECIPEVDTAERLSAEVPAADTAPGDLGSYEMQRGDTLSDILLGESAAGILPSYYDVPEPTWRTVVPLVRQYLDEYEYVRSYIGFPVGVSQWWLERDNGTTISLDRLNDVVMYVGVQYRMISIPPLNRTALREQFAALEQQKTYVDRSQSFTPRSVNSQEKLSPTHEPPLEQLFAGVATWLRGASTQAMTRSPQPDPVTPASTVKPAAAARPLAALVQLEKKACVHAYDANEIAYQRDVQAWVRQTLSGYTAQPQARIALRTNAAKPPDTTQALLALTVQQWQYFSDQPTDRYEWLIERGVRPSAWHDFAAHVRRWYVDAGRVIAVNADTTVHELARAAFANQLLKIDRTS